MDVPELISRIRSSIRYEGQITHIEDIPAREPAYSPIELKPAINYALHEKGIDRLYIHQAEAVEKSGKGRISYYPPVLPVASLCATCFLYSRL